MTDSTKIAFVSPVWTTWQHRKFAGALRYVDTQQRAVIRSFAPSADLPATALEVQAWGAEGVLGLLEQDDLSEFLKGLGETLPVVNCALAREHPNVVTLVADFRAFVRAAVDHFRQLGLRSLGILVLEDGPQVRELLVSQFLREANLRKGSIGSLVHAVERRKLWEPHSSVKPVPPPIANWLANLPKPVGILTPQLGGGGYLIRCCQALGLRVPEDVAVIGGDDTDLSLATEPTLTSMLPALETFGFEAMRLLIEMIRGKRPATPIVRLDCVELHVRESTGLRRPEICDIAAALQCIRENACRGINVEQVIKQTQKVSKVTFHRRFQATVGKTPAEAIRDRKLDEVRRLLTSSELPLTMVSDLCGFSSPKVLGRLFKSVEGKSPRDFRKVGKAARKNLVGGNSRSSTRPSQL